MGGIAQGTVSALNGGGFSSGFAGGFLAGASTTAAAIAGATITGATFLTTTIAGTSVSGTLAGAIGGLGLDAAMNAISVGQAIKPDDECE